MIVSAQSSPGVLSESGFIAYSRSLGEQRLLFPFLAQSWSFLLLFHGLLI